MQQMPDMTELFRLAQTPAGRQLIAMLQKSGGARLNEAITKAAAGDYAQAKETLSDLLSSPEAQVLLKELEDNK
ncbi:MAG: hypothetical protein ACI3WQ_02430 [Faecousia sp.]